jgi:hypothetical protein
MRYRARTRALPSLLAGLVLALGCGGTAPAPDDQAATAPADSAPADSAAAARAPTRIEIRGVDLHLLGNAIARVRRLEGTVVSTRPGQPVPLDDATGYAIEVDSGETWVGYADLSAVLNEYTFDFDGAPIADLEMTREEDSEDEVELKGRLKHGLHVGFEIEGRPEITPDGRIRIRTTSIQALEIPVGGLMHALGLEPGDVMGNLEQRGLSFDGDDMILDASRALPPPRMRGPVTAVRVEEDGILLTFGRSRGSSRPSRSNYLAFRGGVIKIGKMTQNDSNLTITDADPRDPFDFFGEHMNQQLAAGYSKMSEEGALTMFVPDYQDMQRGVELP